MCGNVFLLKIVFMFMTCNNQCHHFKAKKSKGGSRYANGQKYCSHCGVFMDVRDRNCPCCHYQLKMGPSKKKNKIEYVRI